MSWDIKASEFMSWAKENNWVILRNQDNRYVDYMSPNGELWKCVFYVEGNNDLVEMLYKDNRK